MKTIHLNGETLQTEATTLEELLQKMDFNNATIATALNGVFCPINLRHKATLQENDEVEIVAPMQGG